jgi:KDO2-lipid IV(A) lauroyltransferase
MILLRYGLLGFSFLVYIMPFWVQSGMARIIGWMWFDVLRIRRKSAIENVLRVFPEKTRGEATKMARTSLYHMGLTLIEFFTMPFLNAELFRQMYEVDGEEHFKKAFEEGKGVFVLSVHTGNGDLGTAALASWGYPVYIISKLFKSKWLNELWFASRRAKGVRFIPPRKSSYEILKALKKNEAVIFVLDQYTGPPNGILTTFFGHETGTAVGLALFAQRSGAPVVPVYTHRTGPLKHRIRIKPPIEFEEKGSKEETLRFMTEKYNRVVEQAILEAPEQWLWVHRRWKIGFEGQKED